MSNSNSGNKIVINDLSDSIELDREAMAAIIGGASSSRERQQQRLAQQASKRASMSLMTLARNRRFPQR